MCENSQEINDNLKECQKLVKEMNKNNTIDKLCVEEG